MRTSQLLKLLVAGICFLGGGSFAQGQPADPAVPVPVPIQAQIQIQANGGAGRVVRMKTSISNGQRTIDVQEADETEVSIKDDQGKKIEISITRTVDGKKKTETHKGYDFDDLKKKSEEAAKVYEKYAKGNGIGGQLQINVQQNGNGIQNNAGLGNPAYQQRQRFPRKIFADLDGTTVKISEPKEGEISIATESMKNGQPQQQTIQVASLVELRDKHPELAKIYTQLTGVIIPPAPKPATDDKPSPEKPADANR